MSIQRTLKSYIEDELIDDESLKNISEDDNLIKQNLIDSMGFLQLAAFLEKQYSIKIETKEFVPNNFMSISAISRFIRSKQE